jgi:hypothetical protein
MGILRLINLREIPFYIHRLFAFYFIIFGILLLFVELDARAISKHVLFLSFMSGKAILNWFLACMAFFNVNFQSNYWWEYAIGVYLAVLASQQSLMALVHSDLQRIEIE